MDNIRVEAVALPIEHRAVLVVGDPQVTINLSHDQVRELQKELYRQFGPPSAPPPPPPDDDGIRRWTSGPSF